VAPAARPHAARLARRDRDPPAGGPAPRPTR
jgi:hypothetical protein